MSSFFGISKDAIVKADASAEIAEIAIGNAKETAQVAKSAVEDANESAQVEFRYFVFDKCCDAWNDILKKDNFVKKLCSREWI